MGSSGFCRLLCALRSAGATVASSTSPILAALASLACELRPFEIQSLKGSGVRTRTPSPTGPRGGQQQQQQQQYTRRTPSPGSRASIGKGRAAADFALLGDRPVSPTSLMPLVERFSPLQARQDQKLEQEDAHEFLNWLVDSLHSELLAAKHTAAAQIAGNSTKEDGSSSAAEIDDAVNDDGWLTQTGGRAVRQQEVGAAAGVDPDTAATALFHGKLASTVACVGAKNSITVQPFTALGLHILPDSVHSVADAIDELTAPETVVGYRPDGASGPTNASKTLRLQRLPGVLVLHLIRFQYAEARSAKVAKAVAFEPKMSIRQGWLAPGCKERGAEYRLVASVSHHGKKISSGHYTADVLQPDGRWLRFDDGSVSVVSQQLVLADRPYLLFYERI
jgi:ubiquitin carboxyl-terminal hydrolase 10